MINTIWITIIIVLVLDFTDFMDSVKSAISWLLTGGKSRNNDYSLRPADCPVCCSWWTNLIYIALTGNFNIFNMMVVLALAVVGTTIISSIIRMAETIILKAITKVTRFFDNL